MNKYASREIPLMVAVREETEETTQERDNEGATKIVIDPVPRLLSAAKSARPGAHPEPAGGRPPIARRLKNGRANEWPELLAGEIQIHQHTIGNIHGGSREKVTNPRK